MTLPLERNPSTNAQNSISMSQVNVELFFEPNTPISLNQVTVRNLFQKPDNQTTISLWDGFGKSNIGKPKNPQFTLVYQTTARVSWGASDGICNKYTVTVKDAATDSIVYGPIQNFTTIPLQLFANLTGLTAGTSFKVHLLASNTAITPLPTAETVVDLLTLENVPETPTTPVVTVISKNILRVTSNATYASSYDIYEVISGTDTLIASSVSIPYNHDVLTYSLHTYKVKGRSTGGLGPMSAASVPTRSLPDFPIAVSTATCTLITSSSVRVTWTASSSPVVINYRVIATLAVSPFTEVYNSGLVSNLLRSIDPSSTSSPAASFNPATLYTIKVQTINEAGTAETTTSFTTKTAQPAAPTATATSQTAITVTWGTTTGADSYVLYKDGVSLGTKTSPVNDNTGITVYSSHSYQVSAVNVSGESVLSTATSERSFPELPVVVTNVVLTPDMNSIASQWTLAATTSTRTADNYQVYTYLKTNMSTPVDTSALLSSTTNTSNTATQLVGWTQYTVRIYTYNRAGSVYIDTDITTLADIRPDPLTGSLTTITNQEPGSTNVTATQVTVGTFQPNYNAPGIAISASNGQFQAGTSSVTTDWVTTATIIPDSSGNIVFQARMNASSNETTTVTSTFTIGGGSRTFSVTTRNPNPPSNPSAVGGTGIATISWTYNSLYTYTVTADTGQTKTGITSGSVVLGDLSANNSRLSGTRTFYIYANNSFGGTSLPASAVATVTPMPVITHSVSVSPATETSTFYFAASFVNGVAGTTYSWQITGISAADISSMAVSSASGATSITPALTGSAVNTSGQLLVVTVGMNPDYIMEGNETATFSIVGSPVADFANSSVSVVIQDTTVSRNTTWQTGVTFSTSNVTSAVTSWNYYRNTTYVWSTSWSTTTSTTWTTMWTSGYDTTYFALTNALTSGLALTTVSVLTDISGYQNTTVNTVVPYQNQRYTVVSRVTGYWNWTGPGWTMGDTWGYSHWQTWIPGYDVGQQTYWMSSRNCYRIISTLYQGQQYTNYQQNTDAQWNTSVSTAKPSLTYSVTSQSTSANTTWTASRNTSDVYQTVATTSPLTSWSTSYYTSDVWNTSINTAWNTTY